MSKTFLVYIEDDSVGGSHIMHALRHMKKYHHVQDVTKIEPMVELAALREAVEAAIKALRAVAHDRPTAHTDEVWNQLLAALSKLEALP